MSNELTMDNVSECEWDLNFFYKEDYDMDTQETTWDDYYTCQPSLYVYTKDDRALRYYLDSFTCTKKETLDIASGLGYDDSDFFIDSLMVYPFLSQRLKSLLNTLPTCEDVVEGRSPIDGMNWIN